MGIKGFENALRKLSSRVVIRGSQQGRAGHDDITETEWGVSREGSAVEGVSNYRSSATVPTLPQPLHHFPTPPLCYQQVTSVLGSQKCHPTPRAAIGGPMQRTILYFEGLSEDGPFL